MPKNPLFPDNDDQKPDARYELHNRQSTIMPLSDKEKIAAGANPAAELIRAKLERLYAKEPDALSEEREAEATKPRSKHQQFMYDLSISGKGLAEIQTEWHNYYVALPDAEKHQVWQEFYENNQPGPQPLLSDPAPQKARQVMSHQQNTPAGAGGMVVADHMPNTPIDNRPPSVIRQVINKHVAARAEKLSPRTRANIHSLIFGLATGLVVLIIFLFGFFNEVVIAPFIQPSRASATPIIVNSSSVNASAPSVIIPKINVQIPVVYSVTSSDESVIENALESGVVHYPTTVLPGQQGNAAFFGHSSNNIFNKGSYKFAFVLLHKLVKGDTFYLTYNSVVYSYQVISTQIVDPSDVGVLGSVPNETATATLITCDPPGTSLHRLVVVGRQINPDPAGNVATPTASTATTTTQLPGNGPTLWTRLWREIF